MKQMLLTEAEARQFLDLQVELEVNVDPYDNDLWEKMEAESNERLEAYGLTEALRLARPYDYRAKQAEYVGELRTRLGDLAEDLRAERISHDQWSIRSRQALNAAHIDAYRLGVAEATGVAPSKVKLTADQRRAAVNLVGEQYDYWAKFSDKVKGQIADGTKLTTAVDARARLYGGALKSTFESARMGASGERRFRWVRHKADSCATCLTMEGKVKTAREWQDGGILPARQVACYTNCGCQLHAVT